MELFQDLTSEQIGYMIAGLYILCKVIFNLTPTKSDDKLLGGVGHAVTALVDVLGLPNRKKDKYQKLHKPNIWISIVSGIKNIFRSGSATNK